MKKNIGNVVALYPTPTIVVGTMDGDKPTWTLVAHIGIVAHDRILISLFDKHYINSLVMFNGKMSVNIVTEDWLDKADYCGIVSGAHTDKSSVFDFTVGENGTPIIEESRLTMECKVEDIYMCNGFENFICSVKSTIVDESVLSEDGKIDYSILKPVLFEMPSYKYLRTGQVIGHCTDFGKEYKHTLQPNLQSNLETNHEHER